MDTNGLERQPFDGRPLDVPRASRQPRITNENHGPGCRPADPERGCTCGQAEREQERAELAELRAAGYALCPLCSMAYDPRTTEHFTPAQMIERLAHVHVFGPFRRCDDTVLRAECSCGATSDIDGGVAR